jgi:asparagine synthase (glutamine-hydrolysing)
VCGICGIYEFRERRAVDCRTLHDMIESIRHRGPDDDGIYVDGDLALGMRRLSIIDLAGGKQPIRSEDGNVVVVFNGEIYNYRALRAQLQRQGHVFSTACDTEVVAHLYEEYGEEAVHHIRGMFAFAVWDVPHRKLFLARDRLGIKPLYYTQAGGRLVFGSEIKSILQHPAVQARLDPSALSAYLSLKYVPAPRTMFADILALPPGYILTCNSAGVRARPYWDLSFAGNNQVDQHEEAYAEQLAELLREAVQMHLMSDVPFGAFLSGGLDSSMVVALMSQFLNQPVKTFSVGFEGDGAGDSELPYARLVAQRFGTDHHEVFIRPRDFVELAEKVVWHLDQPIADQATLATYMVAELASKHVKMVLTGEGGDELFAGYARYAGERFFPAAQRVPAPIRKMALAAGNRLPGMRRQKLALYALSQMDEAARLANWFPLFNSEMLTALMDADLRHAAPGNVAYTVFLEQLLRTDARDPLSRMLYVDTKLWLPDDLLARGDKMCMAVSVEARVPLLDHKIVEFAASLPPHLKLRRLTRKYLLKEVGRAWLPPQIVDRPKKGFPVPISLWFRKEARSFVHDTLSPATVRRRGLFKPAYVERLLAEHDQGFADHGSLLWGLLNVELWQKLFIDTPVRQARHSDTMITISNQDSLFPSTI